MQKLARRHAYAQSQLCDEIPRQADFGCNVIWTMMDESISSAAGCEHSYRRGHCRDEENLDKECSSAAACIEHEDVGIQSSNIRSIEEFVVYVVDLFASKKHTGQIQLKSREFENPT
jgi:hypothetical protein